MPNISVCPIDGIIEQIDNADDLVNKMCSINYVCMVLYNGA